MDVKQTPETIVIDEITEGLMAIKAIHRTQINSR